jgi:hypothetical protein
MIIFGKNFLISYLIERIKKIAPGEINCGDILIPMAMVLQVWQRLIKQ